MILIYSEAAMCVVLLQTLVPEQQIIFSRCWQVFAWHKPQQTSVLEVKRSIYNAAQPQCGFLAPRIALITQFQTDASKCRGAQPQPQGLLSDCHAGEGLRGEREGATVMCTFMLHSLSPT